MELALRICQAVLFECIFWTSESLTLTPPSASFAPSSTANFTCLIQPYAGTQTWTVDSVTVAECGFHACGTNMSNPSRYTFDSDRITGIFIFVIYPVNLADNGTVVGCYDGVVTETSILTVINTTISIITKGTTETALSSNTTLKGDQNTTTSRKPVGESTQDINGDIHTTNATVHSANKQEEETLIFIYILASFVAIGLIIVVIFSCRVCRTKNKTRTHVFK